LRPLIKAGKDVVPLERWIRAEQTLNRITIGQHPNDLMDRNASAFDAGLAMTNLRVDRNSVVHIYAHSA